MSLKAIKHYSNLILSTVVLKKKPVDCESHRLSIIGFQEVFAFLPNNPATLKS